jgi:hypothetical protein
MNTGHRALRALRMLLLKLVGLSIARDLGSNNNIK